MSEVIMKEYKYFGTFALAAFTLVLAACGGDSGPASTVDESLDNTQEVQDFYAANPELFTFASMAELPTDLVWDDGMDQPEIGSPNAVKGGTYYEFLEDFPPTLRGIGPDSNSSARNWIKDNYQLTWAMAHPDTGEFYPGIAEAWSIVPEDNTVYIKINPASRWTDGEEITVDDAFFSFFFYLSDYVQAPFTTNYYRTEFTNITRYDDYTFSLTVPKVKPDMASRMLQIPPVPQHFYKEFGEDFPERYQWRYEPHAGAYYIDPDRINLGVNIVAERLDDWWAKDNKYFKYRFNPDRINMSVIRDTSKRYEAFRRGDLDIFRISTADMWYDNLPNDDPDVAKGYIHKTVFYNGGPRSNWGLWMNSARPHLDNVEVRLGIQYAANWDLVLSNYFRGDLERLKTQDDGYGEFSHPTITARPFDIELAQQHFANAGFTERGPDGILVNAEGERLAFTLSTHYERLSDIFTILKEEAIKAGLEIRIEMMDGAAGFRKAQEKQHDMYFVSFSPFVFEMYPRMWAYYHCDNAYDQPFLEDGSVNPDRKPKPQTNNLQSFCVPGLDPLIEEYQDSDDAERMIELSHQILEAAYDYASFSPGFVEPFYRTAYWRWVKWPEYFNHKFTTYAYDQMIHWIDQDARDATMSARGNDEPFGAQIVTYDQFRAQ